MIRQEIRKTNIVRYKRFLSVVRIILRISLEADKFVGVEQNEGLGSQAPNCDSFPVSRNALPFPIATFVQPTKRCAHEKFQKLISYLVLPCICIFQ